MPSDTMKVQLRMWSVMTRMEISVFSFMAVGLAAMCSTWCSTLWTVSTSNRLPHPLHHAGQALQAHAGVDVGPGQPLVVALAVRVELAEHQVPDLHKAVAVAAGAAGGLAAAVLDAAVKIGSRSRGRRGRSRAPRSCPPCPCGPCGRGRCHLPGPDVVGLVVVQVDRDIQLVLGMAIHSSPVRNSQAQGMTSSLK